MSRRLYSCRDVLERQREGLVDGAGKGCREEIEGRPEGAGTAAGSPPHGSLQQRTYSGGNHVRAWRTHGVMGWREITFVTVYGATAVTELTTRPPPQNLRQKNRMLLPHT